MVNYYCYDPQDLGSICDWVSSSSVDECGEAATDYVIYKEITIPKEAEQLEGRFGSSLLTIKVKAIIGGEEECGADYTSYSAAASLAGITLLVGLVAQRRWRLQRTAEDEKSQRYVEMAEAQ